MASIIAELDKTLASAIADGYGTMSIRVVVLKKRQDAGTSPDEPDVPADLGTDEVLPSSGKTPVDGYLEDPKRGKECCIFVINGQRQDAWDNTFIVRDLGLKYLRNRMLIFVDLDGLRPEAIAEIMQGSRQGFFQGKVYHAISTRLVATLRRDPDLERLEADAEREISELRAGDEVVKQALDQLIEEHHASAERARAGEGQTGWGNGQGSGFGRDRPGYVIVPPQTDGEPVVGPYLTANPAAAVVRLHTGESAKLAITAVPASAWNDVRPLQVQVAPAIEGLAVQVDRVANGAMVCLDFKEPDDWEDDQYPAETTVRVTARISGHAEPRMLERRVVINKPKTPRPRRPVTPPILLDTPTFIRVTSRQPVPLTPGGGDVHVRLRWDGKDNLVLGAPPQWAFAARCTNVTPFPPMTFSKPSGGRFELLVQTPTTLAAGSQLDFEVDATGPGGQKLVTTFAATVVPPAEPRKVKKTPPEPSSQRRPPYSLLYIKQAEWSKPCWEDKPWTAADAGCFREPTDSMPLVLIINEDMGILAEYRDSLKAKKLEPATIKERVTRYTSHVAFHLYQMYLNQRAAQEAQKTDPGIPSPTPEQMQGEINRVAATLIKVMQVSR